MSAEDKTINPGVEWRKGFIQEWQTCVKNQPLIHFYCFENSQVIVSTSSAASNELKIFCASITHFFVQF